MKFWSAHRPVLRQTRHFFRLHNYDVLSTLVLIAIIIFQHQSLGYGVVWSTYKRIRICFRKSFLLEYSKICRKIIDSMTYFTCPSNYLCQNFSRKMIIFIVLKFLFQSPVRRDSLIDYLSFISRDLEMKESLGHNFCAQKLPMRFKMLLPQLF